MRLIFLIGTNDVGGAEFVSYHHVMMAHRNGIDMLVLSGTTGKFYDMMKAAGVPVVVTGMTPDKNILLKYLKGADVVFNCNYLGAVPLTNEVKLKYKFRHVVILHNNTTWLCNLCIKNDSGIDGYYAIHQKIVDSITRSGKVDTRKFTVIHNCVDVDFIKSCAENKREEVRRELGFTNQDFIIGMITRVAGDKNILDAVRILGSLPKQMNAKLMIIGGPSALEASIKYHNKVVKAINADRYLKPRIIITGNKDMQDVYRLMPAFDIGLNCSPSEGLPIAMLEMMAIGIPCVFPSVGDIPGVLTGRGIVVSIRQRLNASEIFSQNCYTRQELRSYENQIKLLHTKKQKMAEYGIAAKTFIAQFRSLQYQEKEFIKFITMGKNKVIGQITGQIASSQAPRNNKPPVSVLMPTRDADPLWIQQAIESIVRQDYPGKIEFVIVSHDCRLSMIDLVDKLIASFSAENNKIDFKHELVRDSSATFANVLDYGASCCSYEYIVRMDHDDIAFPELLINLVEFMEAHPNIPVCGVQIKFFGAKEIITHHPEVINRELAYQLPNHWFINHPGSIIRKTEFLKVGGYGDTPQLFAEDYRLWCKFLKAGYVLANLPYVLLNYRSYKKERVRPDGYLEDLAKAKAELKN